MPRTSNQLKIYFKDKLERLTVFQFPNLPLFLWIILVLLSHIIRNARLSDSIQNLATAFLFVWAYLELTQGVNYIRKALGAIVLIVIILNYLI